MIPSELSKIEKQILLRAPRERVWRAITNIGEFSKWFGVDTAGVFEPGARLQMTSTHEGHKGIEFFVIIEQMEPMRLFSWRWHPGAPQPGVDYSTEPTTLVQFQLEDAEHGTLLTVIESGFDRLSLGRRAKVFAENEAGWEFELKSLDRYVGPSA
ncbi:MAG: SRPBCC family protein [Acidobacteriia bacterium]|nr:SRPBCC family protein [Terriglobia bacterium]